MSVRERLAIWIAGATLVMGCVWVMKSTDTKVYMRPQYDPSIDVLGVDKNIVDTIINGDTVWIQIDTLLKKQQIEDD